MHGKYVLAWSGRNCVQAIGAYWVTFALERYVGIELAGWLAYMHYSFRISYARFLVGVDSPYIPDHLEFLCFQNSREQGRAYDSTRSSKRHATSRDVVPYFHMLSLAAQSYDDQDNHSPNDIIQRATARLRTVGNAMTCVRVNVKEHARLGIAAH